MYRPNPELYPKAKTAGLFDEYGNAKFLTTFFPFTQDAREFKPEHSVFHSVRAASVTNFEFREAFLSPFNNKCLVRIHCLSNVEGLFVLVEEIVIGSIRICANLSDSAISGITFSERKLTATAENQLISQTFFLFLVEKGYIELVDLLNKIDDPLTFIWSNHHNPFTNNAFKLENLHIELFSDPRGKECPPIAF